MSEHTTEEAVSGTPRPESANEGLHVVRIKHDPESHEYDCHDDCAAEVICPGVTNACRTWWECNRCRAVLRRVDAHGADLYDDRLSERGEAHGVDHEHIDGMWMTPSDQCLSTACDEHDAGELVSVLPDGDHPVDLDWEEGFLMVRLIGPTPAAKEADRAE